MFKSKKPLHTMLAPQAGGPDDDDENGKQGQP
jgi:hypothetical protein